MYKSEALKKLEANKVKLQENRKSYENLEKAITESGLQKHIDFKPKTKEQCQQMLRDIDESCD